MAWNKDHKENSKKRILDSAAKLFAHNGFKTISIDEVMQHAGLTRGAFYSHFKSKSDLYAEAILYGSQKSRQQLSNVFEVDKIVNAYLSEAHVEGEERHCPLAFLVSDINQQNQTIRDTYTTTFNSLVDKMQLSGLNREQALKQCVLMVGGVAISRALNDKSLVTELLASCKELDG
ncbi:TetR/AcrR family transcriptional regulator [uncultured Paraglaciecola sp.]|uniref:TetR/AcrR family transcriptional regulator n=1 Tax=uncultured Paraglaciecola sp. TaxID=1765024 RepID=UPI002598E289|nr:TetR/AcrR family transcriptional regulator [uncultured Paraglaciecola sp.]